MGTFTARQRHVDAIAKAQAALEQPGCGEVFAALAADHPEKGIVTERIARDLAARLGEMLEFYRCHGIRPRDVVGRTQHYDVTMAMVRRGIGVIRREIFRLIIERRRRHIVGAAPDMHLLLAPAGAGVVLVEPRKVAGSNRLLDKIDRVVSQRLDAEKRTTDALDAWVRRRLNPAKNPFLQKAELELYVAVATNDNLSVLELAHRREIAG